MNELRRLELAVIQAAQEWREAVRRGEGQTALGHRLVRLRSAADELTWGCPECNAGGHTCPGDGEPIAHGEGDCGRHTHAGAPDANGVPSCPDYGSRLDPCPPECALGECKYGSAWAGRQIEREAIQQQEQWISNLFLETGWEWVRYAYIDDAGQRQVKLEHHNDPDRGHFTRVIGDAGRGEVLGDFRITVSARRLPPPPPLTPEEDGALRDELAAAVREEIDEKSDPETLAPGDLVWAPRTWADVRPGDDVRLPGQEATAHVEAAVHLRWATDPRTGTSYHNPPQALKWSAVHVSLRTSADPASIAEFDMDPAKPIEIKLTLTEVDALNALDAGGLAGWRNRERLIEVTAENKDI